MTYDPAAVPDQLPPARTWLPPPRSANPWHARRDELPAVLPLDQIMAMVAAETGVSAVAMKSKRRLRHYANARHVFFWMASKLSYASLPMIGRFCGGMDHTTVLHGQRRVETGNKAANVWFDVNDISGSIRAAHSALPRYNGGRTRAGRFA